MPIIALTDWNGGDMLINTDAVATVEQSHGIKGRSVIALIDGTMKYVQDTVTDIGEAAWRASLPRTEYASFGVVIRWLERVEGEEQAKGSP